MLRIETEVGRLGQGILFSSPNKSKNADKQNQKRKDTRPAERERALLRASCPGVTGRPCQQNPSVEMLQGPHLLGKIQAATLAKASVSADFAFLASAQTLLQSQRGLWGKRFYDLENVVTGVGPPKAAS